MLDTVLDKLSHQSTSCARTIEELYSVMSPKKECKEDSTKDDERLVLIINISGVCTCIYKILTAWQNYGCHLKYNLVFRKI
jgi:hypothetical protein